MSDLPVKPGPRLPIEYEEAVRNLEACTTLDDAKYWDNMSDALAAYAKMYNDDEAGRKSKKLKLHSYRKMGKIAQILRPGVGTGRLARAVKGRVGFQKGPQSVLIEHGLDRNRTNQAIHAANLGEEEFTEVVNRTNPPSPRSLYRQVVGSPAWNALNQSLYGLRAFARKNDAANVAQELRPNEAAIARLAIIELLEWLDRFEQALPKETKP
jgi:hypothetical protein